MSGRIPPGLPTELQLALRSVWEAIDRVSGPRNVDWKGRRVINAGSAQDLGDYTTLADVKRLIQLELRGGETGSAIIGSGGGGGGGSTGSGCTGRNTPTVAVPNDLATVEAYDAAHPGDIEDTCISDSFLDGVVAALQGVSERYGYNGKRGTTEISQDAISYFFGDLGTMTVGSHDCYVIDIVAGSCEPGAHPAWINVTAFACGAWYPSRP